MNSQLFLMFGLVLLPHFAMLFWIKNQTEWMKLHGRWLEAHGLIQHQIFDHLIELAKRIDKLES